MVVFIVHLEESSFYICCIKIVKCPFNEIKILCTVSNAIEKSYQLVYYSHLIIDEKVSLKQKIIYFHYSVIFMLKNVHPFSPSTTQ